MKIRVIAILILISLYGIASAQENKEAKAKALCQYWYEMGLQNMENPEPFFKKAIEAYPSFAPPYYWLASFYSNLGRNSDATEWFKKYLEIVDKNDPLEKDRIRVAEKFEDTEIVERSDRLDAINERLQRPLPDKEKADLLFEKAQLMFDTFGALYLRTSTEALLKAIQISPQKRYEEFLSEVYDLYWKNKDFSGDDQVSKDLIALKEKCKATLER